MPKWSSDLSSKIGMKYRSEIECIIFFGLEAASYLTTPPMFSGCLETAYGF